MVSRIGGNPDFLGGIEGEKFTPQDQKFLDKLKDMEEKEEIYSKPILTAAHGGLIDKALTGRNRYI